jgi:hypothetical protein
MASLAVAKTEAGSYRNVETKRSATRIVVSAFGALAALAGIEHGLGEFVQGWVAPSSLMIESWPDTAGFEVVSGEPAMTLIPNLAVSGVVAIVVALAVGIWAVRYIDRPRGGLVLIGLSVLLLLVGGGFGPPLIGVIAGAAAARIGRSGNKRLGRVRASLARLWPWLLGAALVGYLSLVPGMVLVSRFTGFADPLVVAALTVFSFTTLILTLVAASAHDRLGEQ